MDADALPNYKESSDLAALIADGLYSIQYKLLIFTLLIFVLVSSDIFINRVLSKFNDAVDYKTPTSWGVTIQGLFLVLSMIILDALVKNSII